MKKLVIFLFLIAVLMSNLFITSKTNSNNKNQISLKLLQAMADEDPEADVPDPGGEPYPNRVVPPYGWPEYIVYP